jgi:hypothetical protein
MASTHSASLASPFFPCAHRRLQRTPGALQQLRSFAFRVCQQDCPVPVKGTELLAQLSLEFGFIRFLLILVHLHVAVWILDFCYLPFQGPLAIHETCVALLETILKRF